MTRSNSYAIEIRVPVKPNIDIDRAPERNADGTLTEAWWDSLPVDTVVKVTGTKPAPIIQPMLEAVTNETGEKWRDHGVEKLFGVWADWSGGVLDSRGRLHVNGGGHAGSSNNALITIDLERMSWGLTTKPTVITAAMVAETMANAYGPNGTMPNPTATWGGNVGMGWNGLNGSFYKDALGVETPVATHTFNMMAWDSKRERIFAQRHGAFIACKPEDGRWIKLGPQNTGHGYGKNIYDPVQDLVFQFGSSGGDTGYSRYNVINPETGEFIERITSMKPVLSPPSYHFYHLDGVVLVDRDLWFFAPAFQVAFCMNLDTRTARKSSILFPPGIKGSLGVVHIGGSKVVGCYTDYSAVPTVERLLLIDVAAETCVPYEHSGVIIPPSINGSFGRFNGFAKRRVLCWTNRHDTEVRVMRVA